jgi:creatinine amidohydrolase
MTRLSAATWPAIEAVVAGPRALLLPVGATEQHGPHLPLSTDTDLAVTVAERAADVAPAVAAPALAFGSSGEHEAFAGTLSMGTPATRQALVELGRSASRHFAALIFVSTHGGNRDAVTEAEATLRAEGRTVATWWPSWRGDLHAGRTETSLMLAVDPARVDLSAAQPGDRRGATTLLPLLRRHGVRPVSANGVLGDPRGAHAEEGRRLLDEAVGDLVGLVVRTLAAAMAGVAGAGR